MFLKPRDGKSAWLFLLFFALVWIASFLGLIFGLGIASGIETQSLKISSVIICITISIVILIPSILAKLTIRLGLVKTSYMLGKLALRTHFKGPHSGGFFYAWKALQYTNPTTKEHLKHWLEIKLSRFQNTLESGMMAMQIIIKHDPENKQSLIQQLTLLKHCNPKWLPDNIATYCYRILLIDACKKKDWQALVKHSNTWRKFGNIMLAHWVYYFTERYSEKNQRFSNRIRYYIFYCLSGFPEIEKYLEHLAKTSISKNWQTSLDDLIKLKNKEWQNLLSQTSQDDDLNQAWENYLTNKLHSEWQQRAELLGCHQSDTTLAQIRQSVFDQISLRTGNHNIDSDEAMAERDKLFNLLSLKIAAIEHRINNHKLMTGIQEFEELLSLIQVTEKLSKDDFTRAQVYHQLRIPCWNWSFELWEHHKNKPLAFLICSYCAPLAAEYSDLDAHNHFYGIITNKFN